MLRRRLFYLFYNDLVIIILVFGLKIFNIFIFLVFILMSIYLVFG